MAHEAVHERLFGLDRGIPIISEENEGSWTGSRPELYWIVDPIDGTASYAHGFPGYVTQIALMEENRPVVSAINAPSLGQIYTAVRGGEAALNGKRLEIGKKAGREDRVLIDNYPEPRGITRKAFDELGYTKYVECGSISLKMCMVAGGVADLFFKDVVIRDWDIAAPHLVLLNAGGYLCDINGGEFPYAGGYGHGGLVAAACEEDMNELVCWYQETKG
jgi:3'(2'), 5'-bisphosphate nucleotidase/myo-inositol-1(or 4)-monophosphatase